MVYAGPGITLILVKHPAHASPMRVLATGHPVCRLLMLPNAKSKVLLQILTAKSPVRLCQILVLGTTHGRESLRKTSLSELSSSGSHTKKWMGFERCSEKRHRPRPIVERKGREETRRYVGVTKQKPLGGTGG